MRNGRVNRLIGETGKIVMSVNRIKTIIETFLGSDMPGEVQQRFAEWLRDPASRDEKERALENYWNGLRAEEPGGRERKLERLHEASGSASAASGATSQPRPPSCCWPPERTTSW